MVGVLTYIISLLCIVLKMLFTGHGGEVPLWVCGAAGVDGGRGGGPRRGEGSH